MGLKTCNSFFSHLAQATKDHFIEFTQSVFQNPMVFYRINVQHVKTTLPYNIKSQVLFI